MRRGINIIPEGGLAEIVDLATTAEAEGFDRCWIYDEGLATHDVHVTMTAVAAATGRMGIGPGITNPYTRHPGQTAVAVASLNEFSGGRAFLGLGAGGSLTLDPLGIERTRPLAAVGDAIATCRRLFSGELALLADGIEIWLAGRGPRMLALGGERADGVMLDFIHADHLDTAVERVRSGGPAALAYSTAIVTDTVDLDVVRPHMTYRLVDAPVNVQAHIGLTATDAEQIRAGLGAGLHAAAEHVRDEWIEPFVIAGTTSDCAEQIARLGERHGLQEFVLPMFDHPDPAGYIARAAAALG